MGGPGVGIVIGHDGTLYGIGGGAYGDGGNVFAFAPPASPDGNWEGTVLCNFSLNSVEGYDP